MRNREHDLGGEYVLLSDDFYYFGRNAEVLPSHLSSLGREIQGHRSKKNDPIKDAFVTWIRSLNHPSGAILGDPQLVDLSSGICAVSSCDAFRKGEALCDEVLIKSNIDC
jgi:hypothetical protein